MTIDWVPTEFGTAEFFSTRPGIFYSSQYDRAGHDDVMKAARSHIENIQGGRHQTALRTIALSLLDSEGIDTDWYMYGSRERWIVDTDCLVEKAKKIRSALSESGFDMMHRVR